MYTSNENEKCYSLLFWVVTALFGPVATPLLIPLCLQPKTRPTWPSQPFIPIGPSRPGIPTAYLLRTSRLDTRTPPPLSRTLGAAAAGGQGLTAGVYPSVPVPLSGGTCHCPRRRRQAQSAAAQPSMGEQGGGRR